MYKFNFVRKIKKDAEIVGAEQAVQYRGRGKKYLLKRIFRQEKISSCPSGRRSWVSYCPRAFLT